MLSKYKKRRLIFLGSIFVISLAALTFIIKNFRENIVFFYSPSELEMVKDVEKKIKVGGLVKKKSVKKIDASNIDFTITDLKQDLRIHHKGIVPDLFREKQGVVAFGFLSADKKEFFSKELLIKHDENYMPPEVAKSLKTTAE